MATVTQTQTDTVEQLLKDIETTNTAPLWNQMTRMNPPLPNPKATPHLWKYELLRPHLLRAGKLVAEKQAERRVLMLVNPSMTAPHTTDTLNAGLQLVMPNETAPAHRHTAFAMRFIIEGIGGFTAVHGKRIKMRRGDVILTPSYAWHDHGNDASGPMIWLDSLDLPNFRHFPVHFTEHYSEPRYPAEDVDSSTSPIVFPFEKMRLLLLRSGDDWRRERYLKTGGQELSRSLGGAAERLNAGTSSPEIRETSSAVYHIYEGSGQTTINSAVFKWKQGDTFCIPAWQQYRHAADAGQTAYLYRVDDQPMLKALGLYRLDGSEEPPIDV